MMKRFQHILAAALALAVTGAVPCCALAEAPALSVKDLQNLSWHETYQTDRGETVAVDIDPVETPDADAFPVLKVRAADPVSEDVLGEYYAKHDEDYQNYALNNNSGIFDIGMNIYGFYPKGTEGFHCDFPVQFYAPGAIEWNKAYAENNPLTAAQAYATFDDLVAQYLGDGLAYALVGLNVYGPLRKYNIRTGEYGDVLGDRGSYEFGAYELFHGIRMTFMVTSCFRTRINGIEREWGLGNSYISANIIDSETYGMQVRRMREIQTVYDDVPLCSFDAVKAAVEPLITAGLVRRIDSVELVYVTYLDRENRDIAWAVPTWAITCAYFETADDGPNTGDLIYEANGYPAGTTYYETLFVNAQTGALIDPMDESDTRSDVPDLIAW